MESMISYGIKLPLVNFLIHYFSSFHTIMLPQLALRILEGPFRLIKLVKIEQKQQHTI